MKSSSLSLWITSFLGSLLINSTCLAIPTVIPYQGRISVSGAAHTGPGAFRFALTNQNGSSTYWRSDTNPGDQVMAQVVAGDFEIHVGDSAITNMADIPLSVFDNSPLYLRVWFTDTVNPEFELTPAVRLLAAPYAIMARAVEDNSIDTAMIQDGAISGNKLANGSVGIGQLVNGSITTDKLVTGSVGTAQLASGAVDTNILTNSSVTTDKLANGSVTSAKIADDAVTGDHIGFGVIDTQHIANATITSSDIASNTISSNELQSSSVDSDEIVKLGNLVVTTTKIANASVTGPKLTTDALENYGGDVSADAVTAGSIHWAAPKTYRKFIHGGDFHAFQINEESSSALHRVEPFTIRPNKDKPTLFRASFHLPHGATVTGLKFYFDILDTSRADFLGSRIGRRVFFLCSLYREVPHLRHCRHSTRKAAYGRNRISYRILRCVCRQNMATL